MNNDFPRILSLLRKEAHLSQKQVAEDLGVAQALLSHYEKGKRECGLNFLVKVAKYYGVSTDYLLGLSPVSTGSVILESDIPDASEIERGKTNKGDISSALTKKLITNSIDIIFSILSKIGDAKLTKSVSQMLSTAVYRAFRITYRANPKNEKNLFGIPDETVFYLATAGTSVAEGRAFKAIKDINSDEIPKITTATLEEDYKNRAAALLNLLKNCENELNKIEQ